MRGRTRSGSTSHQEALALAACGRRTFRGWLQYGPGRECRERGVACLFYVCANKGLMSIIWL